MAKQQIGEVWIEPAYQAGAEPPLLGVTLVDNEGVYIGHLFKKTKHDERLVFPIYEELIERWQKKGGGSGRKIRRQ